MRVLLTINLPWVRVYAGAIRSNRGITEALAAQGHDVRVVVSALGANGSKSPTQMQRELEADGICWTSDGEAVIFRLNGVQVHAVVEPTHLRSYLLCQIRQFEPDWTLVSSEDPSQNLLAAALSVRPERVVYLAHTLQAFPFGPASMYPGRSRTELLGQAAGIVAISQFTARYVEEHSGFKAHVFHPPHYGRGPFQNYGRFEEGYALLMHAAGIKGISIFLELARELPHVPFATLPGYCTTTDDLLAIRAQPNISLLQNTWNLDEIFCRTRVLLMPSLWVEGFGMTVVDAMVRGIPVLASDFGALREAKLGTDFLLPVNPIERVEDRTDENHWPIPVVPLQNIGPWRDSLAALLTDPELYARQSAAARAAATGFVSSLSIKPLEELLAQLAAARGSRLASSNGHLRERDTGSEGEKPPSDPTMNELGELTPEQQAILELWLEEQLEGEADANAVDTPIRRSHREVIPLSSGQQRLWFLDKLEPGSCLYNVPIGIRLHGDLSVVTLEQTLQEIVRRHEVLRTHFVCDGEEPTQVVSVGHAVELPVLDLTGVHPADREAAAQRQVQVEVRRPFDLEWGPLLRPLLIRLSSDEHLAILTMHHIVTDAWSVALLIREIVALYPEFLAGRPSPLPELPIQYADYAVWQQEQLSGPQFDTLLAYWKEQLGGTLPVMQLPTDRPRPAVPSGRGGSHRFTFSRRASDEISGLGHREGVTPFVTLLATFYLVLRRFTGQDDITVGTDIANRTRQELEGLIGFFINILLLRTRTGDCTTFRGLLHCVQEVVLGAYEHQHMPLEKLVEKLRPLRAQRQTSPVSTLLVLDNVPPAELKLPGLTLTPMPVNPDMSRFDLAVFFAEGVEGLGGVWKYNADLFDAATIERLATHFDAILHRVAGRPDEPLDALLRLADRPQDRTAMKPEVRNSDGPTPTGFEKFLAAQPRPQALSTENLVRTGYLPESTGGTLRLFEPAVGNVDLPAWAAGNRAHIEAQLSEYGAILFRGFALPSVSAFESVARALCTGLFDGYGDLPREASGDRVYRSTPYPREQAIQFHNESSHLHSWPMKQWFYCFKAAAEGGETPIVDGRKVYQALSPVVRRRFEERGLLYIRNYIPGIDVPWQEFFRTTDRDEVEAHCRRSGIRFEWKGDGNLRTSEVRPAVIRHPKSQCPVFFNQIQVHHVACLDPSVRASLVSLLPADEMPRNVYYGDGSPIDDALVHDLVQLYRDLSVSFRWREGDLLMLDNVLTAHSRNPFAGERKIVVALGEMCTYGSI